MYHSGGDNTQPEVQALDKVFSILTSTTERQPILVLDGPLAVVSDMFLDDVVRVVTVAQVNATLILAQVIVGAVPDQQGEPSLIVTTIRVLILEVDRPEQLVDLLNRMEAAIHKRRLVDLIVLGPVDSDEERGLGHWFPFVTRIVYNVDQGLQAHIHLGLL